MSTSVQLSQTQPNDNLLSTIKSLSSKLTEQLRRPVKLLAVSGEPTFAINKYNLNGISPKTIEFVPGYGKGTWSLPVDRVNQALELAQKPEVILTTLSEVMTIRGSQQNLEDIKQQGADIRPVNAPQEVLKIAQDNPEKQVVFFAVGYENSTVNTSQLIQEAASQSISNLSVYCNHTTLLTALKAVLDSPGIHIDGFICSPEIASVIGLEPYNFLVETYRKPIVIAEATQEAMLQAAQTLLQQLIDSRADLENQTQVSEKGNAAALQEIIERFEPREFYEWRGMGSIDFSGLRLRSKYVQFDAEVKFNLPKLKIADSHFSQCMTILTGVFQPCQCKVFGAGCTPKTPMGTYMTTEDGICAMHYKVFPFVAAISS